MELDPELWRLYDILAGHPNGLREYDLLEILRGGGPIRGLPELEIFRVHFLLFHHLHRLKQTLERHDAGSVEIHCLRIRLLAGQKGGGSGENLPFQLDPLAAYYLDLANLETTTGEDVRELLRSFWEKYRVYGRREEALAALGLGEKASALEIQRRYRELALLHHPDRGGDADKFQRIAQAMDVLRVLTRVTT